MFSSELIPADFNYDGVINGSDYTLIDSAFTTQGAQISAQIAGATAQIAAGIGTAVPGPRDRISFGNRSGRRAKPASTLPLIGSLLAVAHSCGRAAVLNLLIPPPRAARS